jgi:hypothetical protein
MDFSEAHHGLLPRRSRLRRPTERPSPHHQPVWFLNAAGHADVRATLHDGTALTPFDTRWGEGQWRYASDNSGLLKAECDFDPHRPYHPSF